MLSQKIYNALAKIRFFLWCMCVCCTLNLVKPEYGCVKECVIILDMLMYMLAGL